VWKIIDEDMSNENKIILCKNLGITGTFIFNNPSSYKELKVPWETLKSELGSLDEREIIKKIQNTTYIIRGMFYCNLSASSVMEIFKSFKENICHHFPICDIIFMNYKERISEESLLNCSYFLRVSSHNRNYHPITRFIS